MKLVVDGSTKTDNIKNQIKTLISTKSRCPYLRKTTKSNSHQIKPKQSKSSHTSLEKIGPVLNGTG